MKIHKVNKPDKDKITEAELGEAKTMDEWNALEKAERKTFKGKIKYFWEDYIYYPCFRMWYNISDIPSEIKYFIQRGMRGYSDRDTWSIDYYLSSWMPGALKQMIKYGNSYPGHGEANTPKKWKEIVKKIIVGFEASKKIADFDFNSKNNEIKRLQTTQIKGLKLFIKWFDALWD
jgi:hypothetical protein